MTFYEKVCADKSLNADNLKLFKEIWLRASDFELWNFKELATGSENAILFIKENYNLRDAAIENIVKAISYEWK